MKTIVVGSGVSGAHAALTLLERGHAVEIWDVGRDDAALPPPDTTFHELKAVLADPIAYFLGRDLGALIPPDSPELLRYPPSRSFLAAPDDPLWTFVSDQFFPSASFAKGGLANGWGANAMSFDDDDMAGWPVSSSDMEAAYRAAYRRIPVAGPTHDDLAPYLSGVHTSQEPVRLSRADARLFAMYERRKRALHSIGVRIGRARLAVTTEVSRSDACTYCDRCLWGCPRGAIYNPRASTLRDCDGFSNYRYVPGRMVLSLQARDNVIRGIRYLDTTTQEIREERCGTVFLAAGALQTGAIFLRTLKENVPNVSTQTEGLMDTSVVKIPFVALPGVGAPSEDRGFQFNRLIVGILGETGTWPRYLHGELLNLTSLIYYPLIERMPFDSRLAKTLFYGLKSALGVATLFFPDRVTPQNCQALVNRGHRWDDVELRYRSSDQHEQYVQHSIATMSRGLRKLRCLPRRAVRSPPGSGIHYAGTVPMGAGPKRCDVSGRSNLFSNLYIADGAAFPSLPSKSITVSLAAHATRVALGAAV